MLTDYQPMPPMSRRAMLQRTATGFGMTALSALLTRSAMAGTSQGLPTSHIAPKAKRCIFLFMNGGPSHLDTFDPKPLLEKYAGQQPDPQKYRKAAKGAGYIPSPLKFLDWKLPAASSKPSRKR